MKDKDQKLIFEAYAASDIPNPGSEIDFPHPKDPEHDKKFQTNLVDKYKLNEDELDCILNWNYWFKESFKSIQAAQGVLPRPDEPAPGTKCLDFALKAIDYLIEMEGIYSAHVPISDNEAQKAYNKPAKKLSKHEKDVLRWGPYLAKGLAEIAWKKQTGR